jgi:hypothetical protein
MRIRLEKSDMELELHLKLNFPLNGRSTAHAFIQNVRFILFLLKRGVNQRQPYGTPCSTYCRHFLVIRFKRLPGLCCLDYRSRLNKLGIESLERRRLNHDLILTYKILFGHVDMKASEFFTFAQTAYRMRGHPYKLLHNHCRVDIRKHFFFLLNALSNRGTHYLLSLMILKALLHLNIV